MTKFFWDCDSPSTSRPCRRIDQGRFFFSGIGSDFLMNGLDCIIFLICAAWILFNFCLTKKQRFSVYSFIENASYILSMEKFGLDIEK